LDNAAIAHILGEIADLLEIKGDNPFKIRAYRNVADIAGNHPHDLATLDETALREIPGIGKDLAGKIREIATTGDSQFHRDLLGEFPPSILEMMRLQGVGPKTVDWIRRIGLPQAQRVAEENSLKIPGQEIHVVANIDELLVGNFPGGNQSCDHVRLRNEGHLNIPEQRLINLAGGEPPNAGADGQDDHHEHPNSNKPRPSPATARRNQNEWQE